MFTKRQGNVTCLHHIFVLNCHSGWVKDFRKKGVLVSVKYLRTQPGPATRADPAVAELAEMAELAKLAGLADMGEH